MLKKQLIAASLFLLPAVLLAQGQTPPPTTTPPANVSDDKKVELQKKREDVHKDITEMHKINADHANGMVELDKREKEARDSVMADKTLNPEQRKAKMDAIRDDFRNQRKALKESFRAEHAKVHEEMKKDREELRKERHELREERKEIHNEMHGGGDNGGHGSK